MGGGGNTTTVQKSDPWSGQQPYLSDIYSQAAGLYGNAAGYAPYAGARVAGLTPMQNQGINAAYGNIVGGTTSADNAETMLNKTLQGGYQQSNPYLPAATSGTNPYLDEQFKTAAQQVTDQFNRSILPGLRTQGVQSGMYNSSRQGISEGLAAGEAQKNLANMAANIYAPAYENEMNRQLQAANIYQTGTENERQRQMAAAGLAPSLSNWGANQLINLGGYDQQQLQNELNAQQNYWNEYQMTPLQRLGNYSQQVVAGGSPGGTTTQSTDNGSGGFSGLGTLAGGAAGYGLAGPLGLTAAANPVMWPLLIGGGALLGSGALS